MALHWFHMRRLLRRPDDARRRGVSAIEFAMILPLFLYFLLGVTELSLVMLVQHLLESATYNASRTGKTGYVESGKTQAATIQDAITTRLGGLSPLINTDKLTMTTTVYGDLSQIGQPEQGTTGLGASSQIVVYTMTYPWKMFTPLIGNLMGDENRMIYLSSRIVVRNEPFE